MPHWFSGSRFSLFLFLAIYLHKKLAHLSWRVSHSPGFANSIPGCSWARSPVLCNSCKFVVEPRGSIRFRLEILGESRSMGGVEYLVINVLRYWKSALTRRERSWFPRETIRTVMCVGPGVRSPFPLWQCSHFILMPVSLRKAALFLLCRWLSSSQVGQGQTTKRQWGRIWAYLLCWSRSFVSPDHNFPNFNSGTSILPGDPLALDLRKEISIQPVPRCFESNSVRTLEKWQEAPKSFIQTLIPGGFGWSQ